MRLLTVLLAAIVFLPAVSVRAEGKPQSDVKGGKDHSLVGRYEGSVMHMYQFKEFEEVLLIKEKLIAADKRTKTERNSERVSGKYTRMAYRGPAGRSATEVSQNYRESLKTKGFQIIFSCSAAECSDNGGSWLFQAATAGPNPAIIANYPSQRYTFAKLEQPQGAVWLAMLVTEKFGGGSQPISPEVMFDIVETKAADMDKVVFVGASEMQQSIAATGRVALYGIQFDFDSDVIKPESEPTLEEISKLLKKDAGLHLIVAGHTDGKGSFDYNVELSRRRAAAVAKRLSSNYGIDANRLRAFGAGMAAPIASNDAEEGRAKNRRVELVKEGSS